MYEGELYRKSFEGPLLLCVSQGNIKKRYSVSHPKDVNKLSPKWEVPYPIRHVLGPGTYELDEMNGKPVPQTWHASNLSKFYC
ncbi:hypothetical protein LIER_34839 [Lithospermum erythrorhizon]|uniref:Uncharacterized protein n=1 Tax=Lithospermum erythrorhizon TaxID=34254 RepID=A0AAV3S0K8_LITER